MDLVILRTAFLRSVIELHDDMITGAPQASLMSMTLVTQCCQLLIIDRDRHRRNRDRGPGSLIRRFRGAGNVTPPRTGCHRHADISVSMRTLQTALRRVWGHASELRKAG
jgi:hypothetical protein